MLLGTSFPENMPQGHRGTPLTAPRRTSRAPRDWPGRKAHHTRRARSLPEWQRYERKMEQIPPAANQGNRTGKQKEFAGRPHSVPEPGIPAGRSQPSLTQPHPGPNPQSSNIANLLSSKSAPGVAQGRFPSRARRAARPGSFSELCRLRVGWTPAAAATKHWRALGSETGRTFCEQRGRAGLPIPQISRSRFSHTEHPKRGRGHEP
jgi:hypothetical protein